MIRRPQMNHRMRTDNTNSEKQIALKFADALNDLCGVLEDYETIVENLILEADSYHWLGGNDLDGEYAKTAAKALSQQHPERDEQGSTTSVFMKIAKFLSDLILKYQSVDQLCSSLPDKLVQDESKSIVQCWKTGLIGSSNTFSDLFDRADEFSKGTRSDKEASLVNFALQFRKGWLSKDDASSRSKARSQLHDYSQELQLIASVLGRELNNPQQNPESRELADRGEFGPDASMAAYARAVRIDPRTLRKKVDNNIVKSEKLSERKWRISMADLSSQYDIPIEQLWNTFR